MHSNAFQERNGRAEEQELKLRGGKRKRRYFVSSKAEQDAKNLGYHAAT
jgi:hypothetical protein